jgi:hypothetical protein
MSHLPVLRYVLDFSKQGGGNNNWPARKAINKFVCAKKIHEIRDASGLRGWGEGKY